MNRIRQRFQHGIPVGRLNTVMALITLLMSALLLITTFQTDSRYQLMQETTENYIDWKNRAYDMQIASDYLTEQARCFVETGEIDYMENYFREANVTRRRDQALAALGERLSDTAAYADLREAMEESVALMDQEYYAMHLAAVAYGIDEDALPEEVRATPLTDRDARYPVGKQLETARNMMFSDSYRDQKRIIGEDMQRCLDDLSQDMDARQQASSEALQDMMLRQRTMIITLIGITLGIVLLTSLLVISPLLRAVLHIRDDQLIPVRGGSEFRFLAQTYNVMYEANRESKEQLTFEATHDKLTGAYNRGGFDFLIENSDLPHCALLLIDVDHFKQINDTLGHEAGDRTLQRIASVIRGSFRSQDYLCRIGGDEFALIMHSIGPQFSDLIREKVRGINRQLQNPQDDTPSVSVSVGVVFGAADCDAKAMMERADAALYQVKYHGRQGCAFYAE